MSSPGTLQLTGPALPETKATAGLCALDSVGVRDQAPPPTSHSHTQASNLQTIYTPGMSPGWLGSQSPLNAPLPQLPRLTRGFREDQLSVISRPTPEIRRLPGPTNGIILGTTQDRMAWGPRPSVILSFNNTLNKGRMKTSAGKEFAQSHNFQPLTASLGYLPTHSQGGVPGAGQILCSPTRDSMERGRRRLLKPPEAGRSRVWIRLERVRAQTCNFSADFSN